MVRDRRRPGQRGRVAGVPQAESEIAEQMAGSEEVGQVVSALEEQYDQVVAARESGDLRDGLEGGELPSGDELAAEFERFLAGGGDDKPGGKSGDDEPPHEPPAPPLPPAT